MPQKSKKRGNPALRRHPHGKQKQSETHHLPRPQQQQQQPKVTKSKARVDNLVRSNKRKDAKIESATQQRDEYAAEVDHLQKEVMSMEKVHAEEIAHANKKLKRAEEESVKQLEKERARSSLRLQTAADATDKANAKEAKAKRAINDATKAKKDATEAKKTAVKEKAAATKERKKTQANALAKSKAAKKKIDKRDEKIDERDEEIRKLRKETAELKKAAAKAKEKAAEEAALRKNAEDALHDMEAKLKSMKEMVDNEAKAGRIVITKESVKGSGFKKWSNKMVQLIMEYLVSAITIIAELLTLK